MELHDDKVVESAVLNMKEAYKPGVMPDVRASFYSKWAENDVYEKDLNKDLYRGPLIAAQAVADYFPTKDRPNARVLDVAAGTGFVSEFLMEHGFKLIDALDPSEGMLRKARDKGLYTNIICAYLDDKKLPILEDTYDCAVTSGGMGEGHIPYNSLDQLVRVVKPGGLICIVMREEYLQHSQYVDRLEPHMDHLEETGCWEKVSRVIEPSYCFDHNGIVYKYRVLSGKDKQ